MAIDDPIIRSVRQAVEAAGCEFVGIQSCFDGQPASLPQIVFIHPRTHKRIILPFDSCGVDTASLYQAILKIVAGKCSSDPKDYVSVSEAKLRTFVRHLQRIR